MADVKLAVASPKLRAENGSVPEYQTAVPAKHDTVVTWGSEAGGPYVSGVPVGKVTRVYSSVRETTQRAVIDPFVDFGALDLVGVVVPSGTASDRAVIEANGTLR